MKLISMGLMAGLLVSGLSFAQAAIDIAVPIPEPGEWAMLLAGLGLMGTIVRRRSLADDDREAA